MPALPKKPRTTRSPSRTRHGEEQSPLPREGRRVGGINVTGSTVNARDIVGGNLSRTFVFHLLPRLLRIPPQILLAVILVGILIWPTFEYGGRMDGLFNIAVADFGEVRTNGRLGIWQESSALRDTLQKGLSTELAAEEWLRDRIRLRPSGIGVVPGRTAEQRQRAARRISAQINAHVLIYGTIESIDGVRQFAPEFYVNQIAGAEEVLGRSQIGKPVQTSTFTVSDALRARTEALAYMTIGLTYLSVKENRRSIYWFEQALAVQEWNDSEGKEVVYLLLGTARMGSAYSGLRGPSDLAAAHDAYKTAASLNPGYSRAHMGLGHVLYERYRQGDPDPGLLDQAISRYEEAKHAPIKPAAAQVDAKLHLSLGNALLVKAQLGETAAFTRAEDEFWAVVTPYERGETGLKAMAAQAYLGLGVVYERGVADNARAAELYRKSIAATDDPEDRRLAETQLQVVEALIAQR